MYCATYSTTHFLSLIHWYYICSPNTIPGWVLQLNCLINPRCACARVTVVFLGVCSHSILLQRALYCFSVLYTASACSILLQRALYCFSVLYTASACSILLQRALYCFSVLYTASACSILLQRALYCFSVRGNMEPTIVSSFS